MPDYFSGISSASSQVSLIPFLDTLADTGHSLGVSSKPTVASSESPPEVLYSVVLAVDLRRSVSHASSLQIQRRWKYFFKF
jgi:hypothetical protein